VSPTLTRRDLELERIKRAAPWLLPVIVGVVVVVVWVLETLFADRGR